MKAEQIERAFQIIEGVAARGERCPTNDQFTPAGVLGVLAREGRIRIAVYAHNFRVVTILVGPHKGKTTMRQSSSGPPYVVIDKGGRHGTRYGTHASRAERLAGRNEPSPPRLLSKDELR